MKSIQFDLNLFGNQKGCTAEQPDDLSCSAGPQANSGENKTETKRLEKKMQNVYSDNDLVERIAELLGLNGLRDDALLKAIKARRAKAELLEKLKRHNAHKKYKALLSEAEQLSTKVNGFDFRSELSNRRFKALLQAGFSVEEAWRAVHINELVRAVEENAKREAVARAIEKIRKNHDRPAENGASGKAPLQSKPSVQGLSSKGIRDILKRVENGAKIKF